MQQKEELANQDHGLRGKNKGVLSRTYMKEPVFEESMYFLVSQVGAGQDKNLEQTPC